MKKKIYFITSIFVFVTLCLGTAFSYNFEFVTVSDVVKKVQERFGALETYQANFNMVSEKMDKKLVQQGTISYKSANKLIIDFVSPAGQKIVANEKTMWIYIPSMNVVAEQDLKGDTGALFVNSKTGLTRLFSKYHYRFEGKEQPAQQNDGSKKYVLFLKQKESRSGFRSMKLWISEDYMVHKAEGETASGKRVTISFSQIKTGVDLSNGMFKFNIPGRARVVKNPMIAEE